MRTFLQNLLIFFALCLCGMMVYQWVVETDLRREAQKLTDTVQDKKEAIQNLQANVKHDEGEIQRLDGLKNQLTQTVKTNEAEIATLNKDLTKATNSLDRAEKTVANYKEAVDRANENVKAANENIEAQKAELRKVVDDRNEMVKKLNKLTSDFNDLAKKWNDQQEELAKAATNSPAKK
jgi:septal ring factor EnvC (AmiA/AmiB activator)